MDMTASFLAGSLLTIVLPVALLTAVAIWWIVLLRRKSV
jgi:hypothetical protein